MIFQRFRQAHSTKTNTRGSLQNSLADIKHCERKRNCIVLCKNGSIFCSISKKWFMFTFQNISNFGDKSQENFLLKDFCKCAKTRIKIFFLSKRALFSKKDSKARPNSFLTEILFMVQYLLILTF